MWKLKREKKLPEGSLLTCSRKDESIWNPQELTRQPLSLLYFLLEQERQGVMAMNA
ncbi:hypothetical protein J6590_019935 [Homalodisca vitripennis]|nr:hypothetical protein J6590_019935 [Homalodisca vitripennis]